MAWPGSVPAVGRYGDWLLALSGTLTDAGDLPDSAELWDTYVVDDGAERRIWTWNGSEWQDLGVLGGETGPEGDPGPAGADGSTWRNGAGAPSDSLGVNGDYYVRTSNGDCYYKSGGTYSVILNLKGPAGASGALSDGDYGDIVVSSSGTVLELDSGVLTAFGRSLIDDVDAAAARSTLGLGSAAVIALDTDTALSANSDSAIPSQKAVKAYVDGAVVGLWDLKGSIDASTNPNYPSALKGDAYAVTVAGKVGGASGRSVEVGDVVIALSDASAGNQAAVGSAWLIIEHNFQGVVADLAAASLSQGDLLYYDGANLVRLPPGTSGQFLKTLGTGANPEWADVSLGGWTLIETKSTTGAGPWDFTSIGSYDNYRFQLDATADSSTIIRMYGSTNGGGAWTSVGAAISINGAFKGAFRVTDAKSLWSWVYAGAQNAATTPSLSNQATSNYLYHTADINAFRLALASGNLSSVTGLSLYGKN